jgi:hypothetical protein
MIEVYKQVLLVSVSLVLNGCLGFLYLSPTAHRCGFPDAFTRFPEGFEKTIVARIEPGMTRAQVRSSFDELRRDQPEITKGVNLDGDDSEYLYFLAGTCPWLRYRFENDHLVSSAYLIQELGFLAYPENDYTDPSCDMIKKGPDDYHWIRTMPKYDPQGYFIGTEDIDDGPISEADLRSLSGHLRDYVPPDSPERNYCKGMSREGS